MVQQFAAAASDPALGNSIRLATKRHKKHKIKVIEKSFCAYLFCAFCAFLWLSSFILLFCGIMKPMMRNTGYNTIHLLRLTKVFLYLKMLDMYFGEHFPGNADTYEKPDVANHEGKTWKANYDKVNMYQAFNRNPVNFVDPMGETITKEAQARGYNDFVVKSFFSVLQRIFMETGLERELPILEVYRMSRRRNCSK